MPSGDYNRHRDQYEEIARETLKNSFLNFPRPAKPTVAEPPQPAKPDPCNAHWDED